MNPARPIFKRTLKKIMLYYTIFPFNSFLQHPFQHVACCRGDSSSSRSHLNPTTDRDLQLHSPSERSSAPERQLQLPVSDTGAGSKPLADPCLAPAVLRTARPTQSQHGLGWKGPLQPIQSDPTALSRDISNQTRLLRAPSNLALDVSRDGALRFSSRSTLPW